MEITIKEDFSDLTESYLLARKYSGLLAKDNKIYRIWFCIFFIIGLFCLIISIVRLKTTNNKAIFLVLFALSNIIFAEKINIWFVKKTIKSYYKKLNKQYNCDFFQENEFIYRIKDGFFESESQAMSIKYSLKDYLQYRESKNFYVIEFTQGKFVFLKKSAFEDKEKFLEIISEIKESAK